MTTYNPQTTGNKPWIAFAGGGTGGHLFPALAVVDCLRRAHDVDVSFFCTDRPIDAQILGMARILATPLSVQAFPTKLWRVPGFYLRWRESVRRCLREFRQRRPAAVVGAGGYASGPPVHAALKLGIPAFLLNPDAVPGRANRHFARDKRLTGIFAQWEVTRQYFPPGAPVIVTGCPVRAAFANFGVGVAGGSAEGGCEKGATRGSASEQGLSRLRADVLASFGLDRDRPMLLVTGASQGARTINEAIIALAPEIAAAGWQVLHLAGQSEYEGVVSAYTSTGVRHAVLSFTDHMPEAMAAAELIVSRAGASTLAEILAVGRPSILLPYPFHRDRHQAHNGQVLVDAGAAVMIEDLKDAAANAALLRPVLTSLMRDDARRRQMAAAAHGLGKPDAAAAIARILADADGTVWGRPATRG
jgi:UDP-N-acetylglucosamine--N-acetylmuramyl-(pentapeptide) pyrophosphoryl-undecaprenol N-acetylglucosamine transferase